MNFKQKIQFAAIAKKWENGQKVSDDEVWDLICIIRENAVHIQKKHNQVPSVIQWQGRRYVLDLK